MQESELTTIDLSSPLYPTEWKTLPDAPQTLWCKGNIELLRLRKFTVVGSRRTPTAARKTGIEIAKSLSHFFTVVTGTADGGDEAAIEGALLGGGKVICILAGGFSSMPQSMLFLLQRVAENGLILSPHPFDTPVRTFSYEYRNKLLAYLGEGTLVLGAAEKSGALITAKYAKQAQKPVFALPYSVGTLAGVGCNKLIKTGGYLTETADDILQIFGLKAEKQKEISLTDDERKVLALLREREQAHVTELVSATGIPVFKIRATLSSLEMKGVAVAVGGNRYAPL